MAGYAGSFTFAFEEGHKHAGASHLEIHRTPRSAQPPALDQTLLAPTPAPPANDGPPPPLLYISSARLAELNRLSHVNQDRPALVHGLIESYGLLLVRHTGRRSYCCMGPLVSAIGIEVLCGRHLQPGCTCRSARQRRPSPPAWSNCCSTTAGSTWQHLRTGLACPSRSSPHLGWKMTARLFQGDHGGM